MYSFLAPHVVACFTILNNLTPLDKIRTKTQFSKSFFWILDAWAFASPSNYLRIRLLRLTEPVGVFYQLVVPDDAADGQDKEDGDHDAKNSSQRNSAFFIVLAFLVIEEDV